MTSTAPDQPAPADRVVTTRWTGGGRALAVVAGTVLVAAALKLAQPVFVPLVSGLFLAIVAWPLYQGLRRRLPRLLRWLALVATMLVVLAVVGAFAGALTLTGRAVGKELRERRSAIEQQTAGLRRWAERVGLPVPAARGPAAPPPNESAPPRRAAGEGGGGGGGAGGAPARVLGTLATGLGGLLLVLAFTALGLAEARELRRRVAHVGRGGGGARALAVIDEAAPAFRRYVWVKTLTSAVTGLATWLAALAFGLPLAWAWGFIAFLFEYVPTVGSVLAVVPPVLMALAEGGPARAGLVLLVIGGLQVVLGNVVDPRLEGRLMSVSPFGVLLSIVVWGWLWGAVGALLAVPLTVAVVIACRHTPGARGVATIVAGDGVEGGDE